MKKLLLSSIVLSLFAISMTLFQLSCKKQATAQTTTTTTTTTPTNVFQEGKLVVLTSDSDLGIENYDGTNLQKLHIVLPTGDKIAVLTNLCISPDHKTIFFAVTNNNTSNGALGFACNIDGTNVHQIDSNFWRIAY